MWDFQEGCLKSVDPLRGSLLSFLPVDWVVPSTPAAILDHEVSQRIEASTGMVEQKDGC